MPVIPAPSSSTHELPHAHFFSLATPSRGSTETSVWRVRLSPSRETAPHTLSREEIFVVLAGSVQVILAGNSQVARAGDAIVVPKDTEVTLSCLDGTAELLCCLPVGGQACMRGGEPFTPPWAE